MEGLHLFAQSTDEGASKVTSVRRLEAAGAVLISGLAFAAAGARWGWAAHTTPEVLTLPPLFVFLYARAAGLDHPTRVRIYNHLLVLPGDHFRSIVRNLRIGVGEGRHHLNVMVRNGVVREARANGRCRYYPEGDGRARDRNDLYEKHWGFRDLRLRVLFAVRNLDGAKTSDVARALGISRQLAAYHLANLLELGLVLREGRVYRAA